MTCILMLAADATTGLIPFQPTSKAGVGGSLGQLSADRPATAHMSHGLPWSAPY